jgi:hypothetical protein
MNHKVIIGCKSQDNIVHFLKEDFIIVEPYIYYKNGKIINNFDVYFNFDGTLADTKMMQLHNIQSIGHRRMEKYEQMVVARKLDIMTPDTYKFVLDSNVGSRHDTLYKLLDNIEDSEKFIIKAENGARGVGQALVTKDEMYKLVDLCYDSNITTDGIYSMFDIGAKDTFRNDGEKEFFRTVIKEATFIIQPRIEMLNEWRFIYFYKEAPILIKRDVSNWQANTSITGKGDYEQYDLNNEDHIKMQEIASKLGSDLNTPFLSIDFYKDKNGIGLFEYQMQMGYAKVPKNELVRKTINSVHKYIEDNITIDK